MRLLKFTFLIFLLAVGFINWLLPGIVERDYNTVVSHKPFIIRPEVLEFHNSLFIADLHSDSLLWKRNLSKLSNIGHVDLPRLEQGNVALQVFSAVTKSPKGQNNTSNTSDSDNITLLTVLSLWPVRTWDSLYERAQYQLLKLKRLQKKNGETLHFITNKVTFKSFLDAWQKNSNHKAALYLIEGAHPFEGKITNLDALYNDGLRIAGLTHFFDNELGGSLHGISGEGLTPFGREVISRANELGLIIDIAHASEQMVRDVLELSTAPTILSHGGMQGSCDQNRNLPDELMQQFAAKGGLIGIGYWHSAVCDVSPAGIVKSIRYAIDLLGVEHVALGSDFDGSVRTPFDTSELAILTQTMLDQGFSKNEIKLVMGENVKRFLLENLPD